MILPLLRVYRFPNELSWQEHLWEICVWIFAGILIYWTGSYLAWILFALYVGYVLVEHIFTEKRQKLFFWFFGGAVIVFFVLWAWMNYAREILDIEKMKGFIARWYLWKTGIAAITHDIWRFLF